MVGVDLGGTKIAGALVAPDGALRFRRETPTPAAAGRDAVLDACAATIAQVIEDARAVGADPMAIGIGSAGVIDAAGRVVSATRTIADWVGADLRGDVVRRFGLPVAVINDVHAHGVGEAWLGAGRGRASMLLVAVGTGIGGAYVVDGNVLPGAHGIAGHLGHVPSAEAAGVTCTCGRDGHLEGLASGPGIHAAYLRAGGDPAVSSAAQVLALVDGSSTAPAAAQSAVELATTALGRAIGGWINTFDPDVVVVGGGVAQAGGRWWDVVLGAAARETLLPLDPGMVVRSALPDAAILGAARRALR